MAVEFAQWRLFVAVADRGSLTKAAESLHTDQPALSRSLRRMERLVGAPLFVRSSQGLAPTELGGRLLGPARALVEQAERLESAAQAEARRVGGALVVGSVDIYPISAAIAAACHDLVASERPITTELMNLPWLAHPRAVLERSIDVGFTLLVDGRTRAPKTLRTLLLWRETSFSALLSERHPLADADVVDPRDLAELPVHLPDADKNPEIHDLVLEALADAGVAAPRRAVSRGTFADVLAQVAAGDGWTVTAGTVPGHLPPGLVARPLAASTSHEVHFAAVWHVDVDRVAVEAFVASFRARWEALTRRPG